VSPSKRASGIFLARLVVFRKDVEHFARPRPLLKDLRWRLDEVAHGGRSGVRRELGAREDLMQYVAKLVKERDDVVMR